MICSSLFCLYILDVCFVVVLYLTSYALQIAKEHCIPFLETSAKANINVEKAFMDLAQAILNKVRKYLYQSMESKRKRYWFSIDLSL